MPLTKNKIYSVCWLATKMATSPEGVKLQWDLTKEDISKRADELIEDSRKVYDAIGALKQDELAFGNCLKAISDEMTHYTTAKSVMDFPQHMSTDREVRAASTEADRKLSAFEVEMSMRKDVFDNLVAFQERNKEALSPEAQRVLKRLIKLGRRNGLHLPQATQDEIKEIKKRMSDISIDFNKNINEENTKLQFTKDELAGLPEDFVDSLEKGEGGKLTMSLKYPHYFPCMRKAKVPSTRQKMEKAFNSRCIKENVPILEELAQLRHKMAKILGYPTHASYITEMRMSGTAEAVSKFLTDLASKLKTLGEEEREIFLQMKEEECKELGFEYDGKINMWDLRYYMTMVEEKKYAVDQNKLKEYFPMNVVTKGLLEIYQELLGLRYEEVKDPHVWHEDVQMFKVQDTASGELMGYFYLDLFPREGKFSHAACFPLQPGCLQSDGTRQFPVAAMMANFTKPTADRPSLLMHDEVETYFHEFGHVMHHICARNDYCLFSGTHVERDFVEAPSQMLENWCWEKEPLRRMSAHFKDSSPLPDEMVNTLVKSRNANAGVFNLRQIFLGMFDQTIHTRPESDTVAVIHQLSDEITHIPATPGTNFSAAFGHMAGGYDAQYYGYLWSEVFSADMFHSRFKKEGIMNSRVGQDYRQFILQPGGSQDAKDMLKNFLGREPNQDAFLVSKGLKVE